MAAPPTSTHRAAGAARSGVVGMLVAAVAFFDGVFIGAPIALLAASFRPSVVYVLATVVVVVFLVIGCCRWVDRRWDDWFSGKNGTRIEKRLETMRASRLMAHPVAWIQRGSDRWYALAAAVANPILVATLARFVGGKPVGKRRIVLGAVAYALPYVAMWSIVGFVFGETIRAT
jgi:ABC-type multidrug transport system fused ATPase/permease subunit